MSEDLPLLPEDMPWEAAQAELEALELGDGLPLVPPTLPATRRCWRGEGRRHSHSDA